MSGETRLRTLPPAAPRAGRRRGPGSRRARSCSVGERSGAVQGRPGGPAAARYVRAQGLRAGMTDREREIPGGGGAALP